MADIKVIFGSSTGSTESAAHKIAAALNADCVNVANATADDFKASTLILGTSTWGFGELQDDWQSGIDRLQAADLSKTTVALFGFGDQESFSDTYLDAMGILYEAIASKAAKIVGKTSVEGYNHSASRAVVDGAFCGLALDDVNEADKTEARIDAWVKQILNEMA